MVTESRSIVSMNMAFKAFLAVGFAGWLVLMGTVVFGLPPRWLYDRLYRPSFMQACVAGRIFDDDVLRQCSASYERFGDLQRSGWAVPDAP